MWIPDKVGIDPCTTPAIVWSSQDLDTPVTDKGEIRAIEGPIKCVECGYVACV